MADLVITAASVKRIGSALTSRGSVVGVAGETITAGQAVRRGHPTTPSDVRIYKSDANSASAAHAKVDGVALNGASVDQPIAFAPAGETVAIGATLTAGAVYIVSANAGGICPVGDQTTGWFASIVGVAVSSANLKLVCVTGEVAL